MLLATLVVGWVLRKSQRDLPLDRFQRVSILIGGFVGATFAAKLPFLLSGTTGGFWGAWLGDGKTILWGLVGGYMGVELGKWASYARTRTGDSFVVAIASGVAVGRIGCLLYGCCYGVPTDLPWGIRFMNADSLTEPRHPTQIYEAVFHFGFAVTAWLCIRKDSRARETSSVRGWMHQNWMPAYIACYAVFRFLTEFIRPEQQYALGLTFYQVSSLVIAAFFGGLILLRIRSRIESSAADSPLEASQVSAG